ncbi:cation:proton antiporter [Acanthopleuribacter pedis]|uniref:Cation:proton antiporter n=1 Tax=Acanthopleuribacter pedis TaxID=442870 RepID=A0A8J7U5M3_9BACT|nr:cation:proton antiporter [Acanthopleuribacter pedis]MBO1322713.1 cation:proton antiporter [Acanthopleuribacter pedis]
MEHLAFFAVALFILAFGSISRRIETTMVTPPMLFVLFGLLLGGDGFDLVHLAKDNHLIHLLAELTLVLVLFTDASRIDLKGLRRDHNIPVRMLLVGLPLCMLLGALAAMPLFPHLGFWSAMVLAIVLAPTDAALGQAVVSSDRIPIRIRQALNVESGLNDGFALPVLLFFICLAAHMEGTNGQDYLLIAAQQLLFGALAGILVGRLGGWVVNKTHTAGWMSHSFVELSALGLALAAFAGSELIGGNGFIGAFCAGVVVGNTLPSRCGEALIEFGETEGQFFTLLTFLFFAALMVPPALQHADWRVWVYALLSLTLVRLIPVAISLLGMKLKMRTTLFLGWFGPRGIASIIYGLLLLEELELAHREEVFNIAMIVVLLSVFLHGLTAWPCVQWYAKHIHQSPDRPEHDEVGHIPLRLGNKKKPK